VFFIIFPNTQGIWIAIQSANDLDPATRLSEACDFHHLVATSRLLCWPVMAIRALSAQDLNSLRGQIIDLVCGSIFVFVGLAACFIAVIRRTGGVRFFALLGIWSAMYGALQLTQEQILLAVSPHWLQVIAPTVNTALAYLIGVAGPLSFRELSLGWPRKFLALSAILVFAIALIGMIFYFAAGSDQRLIPYNNFVEACSLAVLTVIVAVPALSRKYLILPGRRAVAVGTLLFALEALFVNLCRPLGLQSPRVLDHLGFAIFLLALGYGGLQLVSANERRLLSIENELTIAREIQTSILPEKVPQLSHLRVSAAYRPMAAVAGDFYEFLGSDRDRCGFLVADVSGHGVPAALIASMIKVAVQSVEARACDPRAVLCGLNGALSRQLRGQFVSAAYLWMDPENGQALYSAAGHPPLLRWHNGKLDRIESNGLLLGVTEHCGNYPVRTIPIGLGDRFLLYTDGVTEPENAGGDAFGDARLEQVIRDNQGCTAQELSERLLSEIPHWQPESATQQDDLTLLVIDVV
jgi:phosphoserine phosphatase RsbU/P